MPQQRAKIKIANLAYPNQHILIKIPHGSRDHVIVPDTVKIKFYLDIEPRNKTCNFVNNASIALVKKKVLMPGSKETDAINNSDIYGAFKDLYLSEKVREEKLLQGIQSAPLDETHLDAVRGLIQLRGFHPSASTSGARWSDAATSDKDKQICLSTLPRTGFDTEVCSYLAFHS